MTSPPREELQQPNTSAGMDDNTFHLYGGAEALLDLGGSQALLRALQRVEWVGGEGGSEGVLDDDFFRVNHLSSEDRAAVRRYKQYVGVAEEFTKPLGVRRRHLSSPTNSGADSLSRSSGTRPGSTSPSSRDKGAHAVANQSLVEEEFDTVVRGKLFEPPEPLLVTPSTVAATAADPIMCAMNCGREVWGDQTGLSKYCSKTCRKMFLPVSYTHLRAHET